MLKTKAKATVAKMRSFRAEYRTVCKDLMLDKFNWTLYTVLTTSAVPLLLISFMVAVSSERIPHEFSLVYIFLMYNTPTFSSMYLSNFIHLSLMHLLANLSSYLITIYMVLGMYLLVIPYANYTMRDMGYKFKPKILVWSTIVFFTIAPFIISTTSMIIGRVAGVTGGDGFSGIVFAFEGYMVYLFEVVISRKVAASRETRKPHMVYIGNALRVAIPVIFLFSAISTVITDPMSGYVAHTTGFLVGFFTPVILTYWDERGRCIQILEKTSNSSSDGESHE